MFITPEEAKKEQKHVSKEVYTGLTQFQDLAHESAMRELAAREKDEIIDMRTRWSYWLLYIVIAITVFDAIVVFLVGLNILSFQEGYILPIFIGEGFLKVIGLALIVVKFLFNEKSLEE
jgi:hypothetical protein